MLDSHCHLNDEKLYPNYKELVQQAFSNGVNTLLVVGWDIKSSKRAIEIASQFEGVFAAVGIHPENLDNIDESSLTQIKELAKNPKVIAIGEIGLDYHWFKETATRNKQKEWFIKQIDLANELNLPISIHSRDASEDTYLILKDHPVNKTGVLHCYSGSVEMMKKFAELGLYFGFDGPITFKNAEGPRNCAKECPLNRILSETDCPYLTPEPYRGKTNKPEYVSHIVRKISEIKELSIDKIEEKLKENFNDLFHGEHR